MHRGGVSVVAVSHWQEPVAGTAERDATGVGTEKLCNWRDLYPEFAEQLRAAQSARAELMAEEILQIADDSGNDWIEKKTKQGRTWREPNNEAIQRSRLRVETRKYLMEKWSPHHYGAMQRLEVTGPGGGPMWLPKIVSGLAQMLRWAILALTS